MKCLLRDRKGNELEAHARFENNVLLIQHQALLTRLDISQPSVHIMREANSQVLVDRDSGISITIDNDDIPVELEQQLIQFCPQGVQLYGARSE